MRRFYHEQNEDIDALEAMNSQLARYSPITPQPQSAATEDIIIPTEEDDGESCKLQLTHTHIYIYIYIYIYTYILRI
jgi:hypothetical protein